MNKIVLTEPNAKLMLIENAYIKDDTIYLNEENLKNIFYPTMYKAWHNWIIEHIQFEKETKDTPKEENSKILFIFDSFGWSSYYHLLIDTIIPVWITKQIIFQYLQKTFKKEDTYFLKISDNFTTNELKTSNEIFEYFIGNSYTKRICGNFKYIVYGYCYNHRPAPAPDEIKRYYPKYKFMLDNFCSIYRLDIKIEEPYILLPLRSDRNYVDIYKLYELLSKNYKVVTVDFSNYSIQEQIEISNGAWALVGSEGAAFSNQIFMKKGSLIICIAEKYNFHSSLSEYLEHRFFNIIPNENSFEKILDIIKIS